MNTDVDNVKSFIEKIKFLNFLQGNALIKLKWYGIKMPPINDEGSVNVYTTE